jgi:hypothetical protein
MSRFMFEILPIPVSHLRGDLRLAKDHRRALCDRWKQEFWISRDEANFDFFIAQIE